MQVYSTGETTSAQESAEGERVVDGATWDADQGLDWLRRKVQQLERTCSEQALRITELITSTPVEDASTEALRDELTDRGWVVSLVPDIRRK